MTPDRFSQTAINIAVKVYALTRTRPFEALFDEQTTRYYEKLVRELPAPYRLFFGLLNRSPVRRALFGINELLLPGDMMHVLLRKRYITRRVEDQVEGSPCQLLVPGAGFDHLAARFSAEGIPCIEIDLPRMASFKKAWYQRSGYANRNLEILGSRDTEQALEDILRRSTLFDPSRRTVVVAEGLFAYLGSNRVRQMLSALRACTGRSVTLICTLFSLEELPPFRRGVYRTAVRLSGEPLKLHHNLPRFLDLLAQSGFSPGHVQSGAEMRSETLLPMQVFRPVLSGFYLLSAHATGAVEKNEAIQEH